jgi:hypothetical protein
MNHADTVQRLEEIKARRKASTLGYLALKDDLRCEHNDSANWQLIAHVPGDIDFLLQLVKDQAALIKDLNEDMGINEEELDCGTTQDIDVEDPTGFKRFRAGFAPTAFTPRAR